VFRGCSPATLFTRRLNPSPVFVRHDTRFIRACELLDEVEL
jgi:hypothetical protein